MQKKLLFSLLLFFLTGTAFTQYCSSITVSIDKEGKVLKSGKVKSADAYNLLFQKELNKSNTTFYLSMDAASKDAFTKCFDNDKGKIELTLKDKSVLVLENAKCFYNPVSSGFSVTFGAEITREHLETLLVNPIVTFNAFGILKTSFKEKKQMEQQIIASCLLND